MDGRQPREGGWVLRIGFAFYARQSGFLYRRHTFYKIGYDLPRPRPTISCNTFKKLELNRNVSMFLL
jgi:hypothetical protein